MIEIILILLIGYIASGLFYYGYAVFKSFELLGFWRFGIKDGYVVICKYPKFLLFWLDWLVNKIKRGIKE